MTRAAPHSLLLALTMLLAGCAGSDSGDGDGGAAGGGGGAGGSAAPDDADGDGVSDAEDRFPTDASEWGDADNDTVGDNADRFPNDANETADRDGDGVGDNGDAYPDDPAESRDSDGDGVGDNADEDADNDGVQDSQDLAPERNARVRVLVKSFTPSENLDTDGTGECVVAVKGPSGSVLWRHPESGEFACPGNVTVAINLEHAWDYFDSASAYSFTIEAWEVDSGANETVDLDGTGTDRVLSFSCATATGALTGDDVDGTADGVDDGTRDTKDDDARITFEVESL